MAESSLLQRLRLCDLLSLEQLAVLEPLPEAADPDPKALARVVLQRGWLTRFQLSQAAAGRGKELFVGPYLLLDRLGEGAMGQVFKARHRHMNRLVALKLIRKEKLASADAVSRFYQEVQAAAQLHHPNIALAFDAGQAGVTHFFAMEYVDGPDLARLVRDRGPLPVAQACDFIRQAAEGLQHAHERGLVHRDVKPSNLLVSVGGGRPVVKVLDLGLARLGDSFARERHLTRMGQVIGTPDYLAPEQALDARSVDVRADIYSLGCTLYFLLAGRAPFQAESLAELLMKHQTEEAASVRAARPDVPAALEALLRRMMAKKPQGRPATPAEVAAALEPLAGGGQDGPGREVLAVAIEPVTPARGDTWADLSTDATLVPRPTSRAHRDRGHDTIDEAPRGRRKKHRGNRNLPIGVAVGAGALLLALAVAAGVLLSLPKPAPTARKDQTVEKKTPPQRLAPPPPAVPPPRPAPAAPPEPVADDARLLGGGFGGEVHRDLAPEGGLLVGLEIGLGKFGTIDVIHSVRAVFRSGEKEVLGPQRGTDLSRVSRLVARPGYAVGAMEVKTGANADALSLTFMRIKGEVLDPNDAYESEWIGDDRPGGKNHLTGGGRPVVGIIVKATAQDVTGFGLVLTRGGKK